MKHFSKKTGRFMAGIATLLLVACTITVHAQAYKLNQVIVLSDGNVLESGGQHTRVGSYNPTTKVYQDFDTIAADFGCYVIIDSGYIYVAADSLLVKYNLNKKAKVATKTIQGIREMAVWGNQLLVTRGTTYPLKAYFQAYDKNSLSLIYQDTTVSHATQGIRVLQDSAYIAINDFGSGAVGNLGVIDLKAQKENREINLGPSGINPYDVEIDPTSEHIFTINDLNYANSSVTDYNAATTTFTNNSLHLSSGCTSSLYYQGNVYYQASNDNNIGLFNTTTLTVWDSLKINKYIYGMGMDSADGYLYAGQTDYVSYGNVYIYNLFGHAIDSFAVDVAPGNFAFDVRATTAVPQVTNNMEALIYPNPTNNEIHISFSGTYNGTANMVLTDVLGQPVYQTWHNTNSPATISLSTLSSGVYFLTVETANGKTVQKIVKE